MASRVGGEKRDLHPSGHQENTMRPAWPATRLPRQTFRMRIGTEAIMDTTHTAFLSVAELSRLIESKQVSPVEVTEAYLRRIDELDFKFNAYLTVCRQQALHQAREAEAAIARGEYLGPMHGIPVAVKDQLWSKGIRTTGGSRIMADFYPEEDATAVAKLMKAGAILLGKTNLTEFALSGSQRYSPNRNPWDLDRFTGGSSAGSGSAPALKSRIRDAACETVLD